MRFFMVISKQSMCWYYTLQGKEDSYLCSWVFHDFPLGKLVCNKYTYACKKMRDKSLVGLLLPANAR